MERSYHYTSPADSVTRELSLGQLKELITRLFIKQPSDSHVIMFMVPKDGELTTPCAEVFRYELEEEDVIEFSSDFLDCYSDRDIWYVDCTGIQRLE